MLVIFFLSLVHIITSVHLPDEIKVCSKKDPDFADCVCKNMIDALGTLKNGNKNLGVPTLEPFYVAKLDIAGNEGGSVNLNQHYTDVNFHGMTQGRAENLKIDFDKCHWEFDAISPKIEMLSNYELKGQLLVFPINGHGKSNSTMVNMVVHYDFDCEYVEKNGKKHMKITRIKMDMKPERVYFDFENIVPGNEQVSKSLTNTINENWENIFKDVKGAFENVFQQIYSNLANVVFSKIPMDEVFLD